MTVKEHCEMLAEKDGLIVTESQMIRKLEAENAEMKGLLKLAYGWFGIRIPNRPNRRKAFLSVKNQIRQAIKGETDG